MDVNLFLSIWIKRTEGVEAWQNWQRFQVAEPVDNEHEIGLELCNYFLGDGNDDK